MAKALMRPGDFRLRSNDRQMFANFVELAGNAGGPGINPQYYKSKGVVETPVYDVPMLWKLDFQFNGYRPVDNTYYQLSPFLPDFADPIRVTVRTALDRDKRTVTETVDLGGALAASSAGLLNYFPTKFYTGLQVGIVAEWLIPGLGTGSLRQLGVQASLVEVHGGDRDAYGNTRIAQFAATTASQVFLLPNGRRRQFYVHNYSATSLLYVAFRPTAVPPGVGAAFTFTLTPGAVYESPRDCWQGYVSGIFGTAGGATDGAMVSEGV